MEVTMKKILNEKDLGLFLEILAEESVKQAYKTESDSYRLFEQGEDEEEDDPLFGGGDDSDSEESDDEDPLAALSKDAGDEDSEPEPSPEPEAEPKEKKVDMRPTPLTLELGEVTSDGLFATLNMIRAGRSFKEPDVAAQMKKYFEDQLNDSEKLALATFLSAIRDLTSGTPAKDAPEPGDENVSINATGEERSQHEPDPERVQSQPALQQQQQQQPQQPLQQTPAPAASTPRGEEDTSPPIQVGPRDRRLAEEYREHIRSILVN